MVVSKEKTYGGEHLYLMQLGQWQKSQVGRNESDETDLESDEFVPPRTPRTPDRRPRFLLSFGEHAREFVTVESFFHLLEYVLAGAHDSRTDCDIVASSHARDGGDATSDPVRMTSSPGYRARWSRFLLDHVDVDLLGVSNPDGKLHIERSRGSPSDFCWRNTGRGVDLNRNAAWEFNGPGSSSREGDEEYHGPRPFSEAETRFIRDLQQANKYLSYVSVHSGEQQLFVPFVDTASKEMGRRRATTPLELETCQHVVSSPKMGGWLHDSGIGYLMNDYSADGTLMDYMAGVANVPLVFCVELWGGPTHDDCFVQFNPDPTPKPHTDAAGRTTLSSALERDLRRMHIFYIELFNKIISDQYGVEYRDPLEIADPDERAQELRLHQTVCELEQRLYDEKGRGKSDKRTPRVTMQH